MKKLMFILAILMISMSTIAQDFGITPTKENVLYKGIANPVKIIVENYSCESVLVTSNMDIVHKNGCDYLVTPKNLNTGTFTIKVLKGEDTVNLGQRKFRIKQVPEPVAKINGKSASMMVKHQLASGFGITAELNDFIYEIKFKIKSYTVIIERDNKAIFEKEYNDEKFTSELKGKFHELNRGDIVKFKKITVTEPDGSERVIQPLRFEIK